MMRVLFLCTLILMGPSFGLAQEKHSRSREDLRYDGKPFSYWENPAHRAEGRAPHRCGQGDGHLRRAATAGKQRP